jgi:transcriptional regulator NrdR family protein
VIDIAAQDEGHAITEIACILDDLAPLPQPGDADTSAEVLAIRRHRNHEFYYACPVCSRNTTDLAEALVAGGYRVVKVDDVRAATDDRRLVSGLRGSYDAVSAALRETNARVAARDAELAKLRAELATYQPAEVNGAFMYVHVCGQAADFPENEPIPDWCEECLGTAAWEPLYVRPGRGL